MSDLTRRSFIGTMAVATGAFTMPRTMEGGDPSFQNNVPDPLLAGKELPSFKFELEKSKGKAAWIAGNPVDVLATNFNKPASLFEKFPRKDVFISPNQ